VNDKNNLIMNCKIIKKTNPLGGVKYIALVKKKFLFFIPLWYSIDYSSYSQNVSLDCISYTKYKHFDEAKEAVQKYYLWNKGTTRVELIGCDGSPI
jgi:hypothetical protein